MDLVNRGPAPVNDEAKVMGSVEGLTILNTSYIGVPFHRIEYPDPDFAHERDRAMNHNTDDGIKPLTPEQQAHERELAWELIKRITKKIFSMDPMSISFPVDFNDPRTSLERMADNMVYLANKYIDLAFEESNPEKRLGYIAAGIIASFQLQMQQKKPWNPVLGETYSGRYFNGNRIYAEQTSHHPPITAIEIIGDKNKWRCHSVIDIKVSSGPFKAEIYYYGSFKLELGNGVVIEWNIPTNVMTGIISGDRLMRMSGPVEIKDVANNIGLKFDAWPKKDKSKGILKTRSSTIWGCTYLLNEKKATPRMILSGDYTDKIMLDSEVIWDISQDFAVRPLNETPQDDILLSDSRFRIDRGCLIDGKMSDAEVAKKVIEESQRREEKLRRVLK